MRHFESSYDSVTLTEKTTEQISALLKDGARVKSLSSAKDWPGHIDELRLLCSRALILFGYLIDDMEKGSDFTVDERRFIRKAIEDAGALYQARISFSVFHFHLVKVVGLSIHGKISRKVSWMFWRCRWISGYWNLGMWSMWFSRSDAFDWFLSFPLSIFDF